MKTEKSIKGPIENIKGVLPQTNDRLRSGAWANGLLEMNHHE